MYRKLGFGRSPSFAYMQEDPMWLTRNQNKNPPLLTAQYKLELKIGN
jgi:hypothetical protein